MDVVTLQLANANARKKYGTALPNDRSRSWRTAVAQVRAGVQDSKLLCLGDSTTFGIGSNPGDPSEGGGVNCYPRQLATQLNNTGLPSSMGYIHAPSQYSGNTNPQWTTGAGWTKSLVTGGSCWGWISEPTGGALVFTPGASAGIYDTFDVYYGTTPTATSITVTATGGSPVAIGTNGGGILGKVTVTAASASSGNAVTIVPTTGGGNAFILGVEAYHSTERRMRVANFGLGSSRVTSHWNPAATVSGEVGLVTLYNPDVTVISLGINDIFVSATTELYTTRMMQLVAHCLLYGDVMVMSSLPISQSTAIQVALQETYQVALFANEAANNYTYFDLRYRWGDGATAFNSGFKADFAHGTPAAYCDIASFIARNLLS